MGKIKNTKIKKDDIDTAIRIQNNILGSMDYLVGRLVKSAELLKSRVEHIALVYDDGTFLDDRFKDQSLDDIEGIKGSIESFAQEHTVEFAETLNKAMKTVDKLHHILSKG